MARRPHSRATLTPTEQSNFAVVGQLTAMDRLDIARSPGIRLKRSWNVVIPVSAKKR